MIPQADIDEATKELLAKTRQQIDEETALKWAARALVAYHMWATTRLIGWFSDATQYQHEAVEHAADTPILQEIIWTLDRAKKDAMGKGA